MARASIYYYRRLRPQLSEEHADLYEELQLSDDDGPITITKTFFNSNWGFVGYEEFPDDKPLKQNLERTWRKYNLYEENPLSVQNSGQHKLEEAGVSHTSMSVGDVVKLDDRHFIAAPIGWRRLQLESFYE